ncbi:MAG: redoxin domain-containing protein [Verrucomicrobiota bacterium]
MALPTGTQAPDFSLKTKTSEGIQDVVLSSNFGKKNTVLLFFPLAFTGVCTQEMCDISAGFGIYKKLHAEVYGISVDSPFAQEAWAQAHHISIPLLSDLNKLVSESYDVLLQDLMGLGSVSARAAFAIDKTGKIVYSEQTPTPKDLPNFQKVQEALQKVS